MLKLSIIYRFSVVWGAFLASTLGCILFFKMPVELLPQSNQKRYIIQVDTLGTLNKLQSDRLAKDISDRFKSQNLLVYTQMRMQPGKLTVVVWPETYVPLMKQKIEDAFRIKTSLTWPSDRAQVYEISPSSKAIIELGFAPSDSVSESEFVKILNQHILTELETVEQISFVDLKGLSEASLFLDSREGGAASSTKSNAEVLAGLATGYEFAETHDFNFAFSTAQRQTEALRETENPLPPGVRDERHIGRSELSRFTLKNDGSGLSNKVKLDGKSAVILSLYKKPNENDVVFSKAIHDKIKTFSRADSGVMVSIISDNANYIIDAEANVVGNVFWGIFLTCLCILFFMRSIQSTLLVSLSLPLSLLLTFPILWALGISRNVMSLAGIALGVGVVVDATLTVLEGINERILGGASPKYAALKAAEDNLLPIGAAVLTTLAVFLPILALPGFVGDLFYDLSLTIIVSQCISFVVAMVIMPALTSAFYDFKLARGLKAVQSVQSSEVQNKNFIMQSLKTLLGTSTANWGITISLIVAIFWSFSIAPAKEFLPQSSSDDYRLIVKTGTYLREQDFPDFLKKLDSTLSFHKTESRLIEVQPDQIVADFSLSAQSQFMSLNLDLEKKLAPFIFSLNSKNPINPNAAEGKDVEFYVTGDRAAELYFREEISALQGVTYQNWSNSEKVKTAILRQEREYWQSLRVPEKLTDTAWSLEFQQSQLGLCFCTLNPQNPVLFPVISRNNSTQVSSLSALTSLPQPSEKLNFLSQVSPKPSSYYYLGDRNYQKVYLSLRNKTSGEISEKITHLAKKSGLDLKWDFDEKSNTDSMNSIFYCICAATFLILIILYQQNRSINVTIIIMFTFFWAFIGVFPGLQLHGESLHSSVLVGFILLSGTVVNNGILLMDIVQKQRRLQKSPLEACLNAVQLRAIPVIVTSLTTVLGMIPMVFDRGAGSQLYRGLSIVVVYGTIISTPLSLIGIPCLVMIFEESSETYHRFLTRLKISFEMNLVFRRKNL